MNTYVIGVKVCLEKQHISCQNSKLQLLYYKRNTMAEDRKDREFSNKIKTTLGERSHFLCSNPTCRKMTTGPHTNHDKSLRSGEAAHIYSAKSKIARYNKDLTSEQVRDIKNGIWLCRDCHKLIDHDEKAFPVKLLLQWKNTHENFVKALRSKPNSGTLRLIQPTIDEEMKASEILDYLDDRRALHRDFQMEIPSQVFESLQETRKYLVKKKSEVGQSYLSEQVDKILKSIRGFLDTIYDVDINLLKYDKKDSDWIKFENSLSVLRKVIGVIVFEIAEKYSLKIGYELQNIIPEN